VTDRASPGGAPAGEQAAEGTAAGGEPAGAAGTIRMATVLGAPYPAAASAAPPGTEPEEFRLALLEDTYEVIAGLELVRPALAVYPPDQVVADSLVWPGTPVLALDPDADPLPQVFAAMRERGAREGLVVAPDAPDLPPLLIGKLFRALGRGDVAICPAAGGGLVGFAVRLPAPDWVLASGVGLDTLDAPARLRGAAPRQGRVRSGPGWHRLRERADLARLDPALEGWETTRALLTGYPL
jgi:hypothetical protein